MPPPPISRQLPKTNPLPQSRDQRARLADVKTTLDTTGLIVFSALLEMHGPSPVLPMVHWASALRKKTSVSSSTLKSERPTINKPAKTRAGARKIQPKAPTPQFVPPFTSTLPRVAGWCRALSRGISAPEEVPGLAFQVKTINVTGKSLSNEVWQATIVWIYEHKTGSLFHYVPTEGSRSQFTYIRLWLCLEKAVEILRHQPAKKFQTVPTELFETQMTVFLPLDAGDQPMVQVFNAAQQHLDQHRESGQMLYLQKVKGKSVELDSARWQVKSHGAAPIESYETAHKSKNILISSLARFSRAVTTNLAQLQPKNQSPPQEKSEENASQQQPNNGTRFTKRKSIPDDLRYSWRPLTRVRHQMS